MTRYADDGTLLSMTTIYKPDARPSKSTTPSAKNVSFDDEKVTGRGELGDGELSPEPIARYARCGYGRVRAESPPTKKPATPKKPVKPSKTGGTKKMGVTKGKPKSPKRPYKHQALPELSKKQLDRKRVTRGSAKTAENKLFEGLP